MNVYLKGEPLLGALARVSVGDVQIIVDSNVDWLKPHLTSQLSNLTAKLNLNELLLLAQQATDSASFLKSKWIQPQPLRMAAKIFASRRPIWYLDELIDKPLAKPFFLPLLSQLLFEKFQGPRSRVLSVRDSEGENKLVLAVKLLEQKDLLFFTEEKGRMVAVSSHHLELARDFFKIEQLELLPTRAKNDQSIHVVGFNNIMISLKFEGRTPSDRRFEAEESLYKKAEADELIPIELFYHPYYRAFGHTTIRIGRAMYELSSYGWRCHNVPISSARAFLFNNPFFKSQFERYRRRTPIPPFSIGKTILLPKATVIEIHVALQNLCAAQGFRKPRFNLLFNNCNQGISRVMRQCGVTEFANRGFMAFSTVLTFRKLLFDSQLPSTGYRIYLMPGFDVSSDQVRALFPKFLYRENSPLNELRRSVPIYLSDMFQNLFRWLEKRWSANQRTKTSNVTNLNEEIANAR